MLKIGVIGLGVGEAHLEAFKANPHCTVTSICDFSADQLSQVSSRYPEIKKLYHDSNALIDDPEVSLVCVASYDNHHCEQVVRAINKKKHVFVEKPLCIKPDEASRINKALKSNPDVKLTSNLILRKSPRFQELKQMIDDGRLGRPYLIEGDYNYGRLHKIVSGWRGVIEGYSPVFGGGVHILDQFLWLMKERVTEVSAFGSRLLTKDSQYKYDDTVIAILRFESGALGKLGVNLGCVYPHFHRFSLYGSKATFENGLEEGLLFENYDSGKGHGEEKSAYRPAALKSAYPGMKKGDLIDNFVDHILNGTKLAVTPQEVFDAMSVCFAIVRSAEEQTPVKVEYL